jgi:hypothetical protein
MMRDVYRKWSVVRSPQLRPGVGAHGEGQTREAAVADLREVLEGLIAEFGAPQGLTLTVDVA